MPLNLFQEVRECMDFAPLCLISVAELGVTNDSSFLLSSETKINLGWFSMLTGFMTLILQVFINILIFSLFIIVFPLMFVTLS